MRLTEVRTRQAGLFGLSDHLKRLSDFGDPLEELPRVVDFEVFRPALVAALAYGDGTKGGRPPYDPVAMLKVLLGHKASELHPRPSQPWRGRRSRES